MVMVSTKWPQKKHQFSSRFSNKVMWYIRPLNKIVNEMNENDCVVMRFDIDRFSVFVSLNRPGSTACQPFGIVGVGLTRVTSRSVRHLTAPLRSPLFVWSGTVDPVALRGFLRRVPQCILGTAGKIREANFCRSNPSPMRGYPWYPLSIQAIMNRETNRL